MNIQRSVCGHRCQRYGDTEVGGSGEVQMGPTALALPDRWPLSAQPTHEKTLTGEWGGRRGPGGNRSKAGDLFSPNWRQGF